MPPNQSPWPRRWLMTDERMGDSLWRALKRLPRGSGVIVRHDKLGRAERARLAGRIARICRRRGLVLGVAGDVALARRVGAALIHRPERHPGLMPTSWPVHDEGQALAARRKGAALAFVSPVFATRSHPGAEALGVAKAKQLALLSGSQAIAMGGMSEERFGELSRAFHGYAGIDCWKVRGPSRE
jgi:thiamine-phosphate pyrophosphorylase